MNFGLNKMKTPRINEAFHLLSEPPGRNMGHRLMLVHQLKVIWIYVSTCRIRQFYQESLLTFNYQHQMILKCCPGWLPLSGARPPRLPRVSSISKSSQPLHGGPIHFAAPRFEMGGC